MEYVAEPRKQGKRLLKTRPSWRCSPTARKQEARLSPKRRYSRALSRPHHRVLATGSCRYVNSFWTATFCLPSRQPMATHSSPCRNLLELC